MAAGVAILLMPQHLSPAAMRLAASAGRRCHCVVVHADGCQRPPLPHTHKPYKSTPQDRVQGISLGIVAAAAQLYTPSITWVARACWLRPSRAPARELRARRSALCACTTLCATALSSASRPTLTPPAPSRRYAWALGTAPRRRRCSSHCCGKPVGLGAGRQGGGGGQPERGGDVHMSPRNSFPAAFSICPPPPSRRPDRRPPAGRDAQAFRPTLMSSTSRVAYCRACLMLRRLSSCTRTRTSTWTANGSRWTAIRWISPCLNRWVNGVVPRRHGH